MMIVGWNDEYLGGGFILKNSLTNKLGHSLGYFTGEYSLLNENQVCPTYNSIKQWIPINYDCLVEKGDVNQCPNITRIFVGKNVVGGTVLKCNGDNAKAAEYGFSECATEEGKSYNYALEAIADGMESHYKPLVEYVRGSNGLGRYHLLRWKDGNEKNVERIQTQYTTAQFMENVFVPKDVNEYQNSEHCGYFFMSYDIFLQHETKLMNGGHQSYVFSSFDVSFNKDKLKDVHSFDKSIMDYSLPSFDGSLDF